MTDAPVPPPPASAASIDDTATAAGSRRRRVRELVLAAAKARTQQALTLGNDDDGDATTPLFAPYSPSPMSMINAVWEYLDAHAASAPIASEELLVDLGCGDARWLISGVQRYRCQALGIEIDSALVEKAQLAVEKLALGDKIRIVKDDILHVDISQAKVVIVYAFAESLHGIRAHLERQLSDRASVLSIGVRVRLCILHLHSLLVLDSTDVVFTCRVIMWLQFRVPEWRPKWSDRVDGLRWYFYELKDSRL